LHQLSQVLVVHQHIPLPLARTLLEQVYPTNWDLDPNTVNNFIVKCRIYKSMSDSTKPLLKPNINIPGKLELVGMSQQDLIDKSLLVSWDCLQEHLKEEGQSWYVTSMMEYLKQSDDGFDYRICKKQWWSMWCCLGYITNEI